MKILEQLKTWAESVSSDDRRTVIIAVTVLLAAFTALVLLDTYMPIDVAQLLGG